MRGTRPFELPDDRPAASAAARILALLALTAAAGGMGCSDAPAARNPRVSVSVAQAEQRTVPYALVATGTVEALQTASVGAQVGGVVKRIAFREGQEVTEGQLLVELDARPFRATLEQARAALDRDRAQARAAQLDLDRSQPLFQQQLLSEAELEQKRAASDGWNATVRAESATVQKAKLDLEYASIRAPISGRTGQVLVHQGDLVPANSRDPLVLINRIQPVRVRFTVPASEVPLVQRYRNGRPRVIITSATGDSITREGPLVFVDNAVDPSSGTLLLKGEFTNRDGRLVPGEFVDVRLVLYEEPGRTVVPAVAVTNGQNGSYVYVMNPDSTVTSRPVTVARVVDELSVVSAGLAPGETVIVDGQLRLSPGARVLVRAPVGGSQ